MNGSRADARAWAEAAVESARGAAAEVAVFPPFPWLDEVARALAAAGGAVGLGAQGCHPDPSGAHTAGVSARMLAEAGCRYVLCGHSETRAEQRLDDARVGASAAAAAGAGLVPLLCVGESLAEREAGRAREVVLRQLEAGTASLPRGARLDVAYEPVWAIGTGKSAAPEQAEEVHAWLRKALSERGFGGARILYGGSVAHGNVAGFLSRPGVDGVLVGGQSLDPPAFRAIVRAAS
jgi:triosephosphate isomerase